MERDYFLFKTDVSFGIRTDTIEPDLITEELNINCSGSFKKGDFFTSKFSQTVGQKQWNLWSIDSESTTRQDETVSHHIQYLKEILLPKADIIKKYKESDLYDVSFSIWIETDDAGIGLDLEETEMAFLNEFSNRVSFLLTTKDLIYDCEAKP